MFFLLIGVFSEFFSLVRICCIVNDIFVCLLLVLYNILIMVVIFFVLWSVVCFCSFWGVGFVGIFFSFIFFILICFSSVIFVLLGLIVCLSFLVVFFLVVCLVFFLVWILVLRELRVVCFGIVVLRRFLYFLIGVLGRVLRKRVMFLLEDIYNVWRLDLKFIFKLVFLIGFVGRDGEKLM